MYHLPFSEDKIMHHKFMTNILYRVVFAV